MTLTQVPDLCPYCGTQMENSGAPIWEDYCPSEACTGHREAFWAALRSRVKAYGPKDELRYLRLSILQCNTLGDFMAVKKTVEAIREAEANE